MTRSMICGFQGEHRFLSNFYPATIAFDGITFPTAEHAYVAAKSNDPADWARVLDCATPGEAKRLGRQFNLRPDWELIKLDVMRTILQLKFQDPELRRRLLSTGNAELLEENDWNDTYWGITRRGVGHNHLGKLLMEIRSTLT